MRLLVNLRKMKKMSNLKITSSDECSTLEAPEFVERQKTLFSKKFLIHERDNNHTRHVQSPLDEHFLKLLLQQKCLRKLMENE